MIAFRIIYINKTNEVKTGSKSDSSLFHYHIHDFRSILFLWRDHGQWKLQIFIPKVLFNDECVSKCPRRTYFDPDYMACKQCTRGFSSCTGPHQGQCQECYPGFQMEDGTCHCFSIERPMVTINQLCDYDAHLIQLPAHVSSA